MVFNDSQSLKAYFFIPLIELGNIICSNFEQPEKQLLLIYSIVLGNEIPVSSWQPLNAPSSIPDTYGGKNEM